MDFSNISFYGISGLVNFFTSLIFGTYVYFKDRSKQGRIFAIFASLNVTWSFLYFLWQISDNAETAMLTVQLLMIPVSFLSAVFFHFVLLLIDEVKKYKAQLISAYVILGFFSLTTFTPFFVRAVEPFLDVPFEPKAGSLFWLFLLCWFGYFIYATIVLLSAYRGASAVIKAQIRYISVGVVVAYLTGSTNFLLWYEIPIRPVFTIGVSLYVIAFAYATLKHHLFNVKTFAVEMLTFILWAFLLVRILLGSRSPEAILPDLILFIAVVIIGVFLIRAGLREAKLNIKLDDLNHNLQKKVDEQTKEIRTAYEVEKKARVELEELNHAKNDFILASQHNLRTPLTVANGYIEQIGIGIEKGDIGSLHTYLDKTTGAMETMAKLVNGLIDVTDLKVGKGGLVEKAKNK